MLDGTEEQFTYNSENYWILTKDYPLNGKTVDELDHELRSKAYCVHVYASPLDYGNHDSYFFINKKTIPEDLDYYVYPRAMGNAVEGRKTWQTELLYYSTTPAIDFFCKAATFYMKESPLGGDLQLVFDYSVTNLDEKFKHNIKSVAIDIDEEHQEFDISSFNSEALIPDNVVTNLRINQYRSYSGNIYNYGFLDNTYKITITDGNNIDYSFVTQLTYKYDTRTPIPMTKTKLNYNIKPDLTAGHRASAQAIDEL